MGYELKHVTVKKEGRTILNNVSCTIERNKWIAVVGQTGAGKSTFVQVLKGLHTFEGDYFIDGLPIEKNAKGIPNAIDEVGIVFQYPEHQLFETTVCKELSFGLKLLGYSKKDIDESIQSIAQKMDISNDMLELPPFQLSGGQKRRVAIASILLMNPKLLIVDEPTAGLDPVSREYLLHLLKTWQQETKGTILFVTHQMDDVAEYADEVLIFHHGELQVQIETDELFLEKPQLLKTAQLRLPESVEALHVVEQLIGKKIDVRSCKEQAILQALQPFLCGVSK